jgi:hypothetical protein
MDAQNLAAGIIVLDTGLPDWSCRRLFDAARNLGLTMDAAAVLVGELVAEIYNEGRPEPCVSLHGKRTFREAGRRTYWTTTDKFRVGVEQFNDGWGWHAWETLTDEGWRSLFTPTLDNARRRFRTHERAGEFFLVLAEIIAGNGSELVPTRLSPPGAVAPTRLSRR